MVREEQEGGFVTSVLAKIITGKGHEKGFFLVRRCFTHQTKKQLISRSRRPLGFPSLVKG